MLESVAWGKLTRDAQGSVTARLALLLHSIDVAAVVLALLKLPTIRARFDRLAGRPLSSTDVERLVVLALCHDIGKCSVGFQSKCLTDEQRQALLRRVAGEFSECGHTLVVGPLFNDQQLKGTFKNAFPIEKIFQWDQSFDLLFAAISHHGTPINFDQTTPSPRWAWRADAEYDPIAGLKALGEFGLQTFPAAFADGDVALPDAPQLVHAFAGLVSFADWIGSNTHHQFFPYHLDHGHARWGTALLRAEGVLRQMRIDLESARADLRKRAVQFSDVFVDEETGLGLEPSHMQSAMAAGDLGRTIVVESETGSGKTEAALWRFKTLFEAGAVDALVFALPTRVSAVQLYDRVHLFVQRLFPDATFRPNVLLAVPGYMRVDAVDAVDLLANHEVLWPDHDQEGVAHLRWAAENSKRYLAAACAVGTVDQVLLSGLRVRHAHLRGFALLRSLLVVDEVHASDLYMTYVLEGVIRRQEAAGAHTLLLSATLGIQSRQKLLSATVVQSETEPPEVREQAPYPCVSDQSSSRAFAQTAREKRVRIELQPWLDAPECIAGAAAEAVNRGARVLIIRNTVRGVLSAQLALESSLGRDHPSLFRCESVVCPHHGRYAGVDRVVMDRRINDVLGKRSADGPAVLCGSQTLEQSLDIDADLLITDLAPMDVLLQRLGRLFRHAARKRPSEFSSPRVIVLTPDTENLDGFLQHRPNRHGLGGFVYRNLIAIAATWRELKVRPELSIPRDNRILVERCTDPTRLADLAQQSGEDWVRHWINREGEARAQTNVAEYSRLDWSKPWAESAFPPDDERIRTRLGNEAVQLTFPEPMLSPFGQVLSGIAIPAWMWRGGKDPSIVDLQRSNEGLVVSFGSFAYSYTRFGLAHCLSQDLRNSSGSISPQSNPRGQHA